VSIEVLIKKIIFSSLPLVLFYWYAFPSVKSGSIRCPFSTGIVQSWLNFGGWGPSLKIKGPHPQGDHPLFSNYTLLIKVGLTALFVNHPPPVKFVVANTKIKLEPCFA
jgi:hypothetical protein